MVRSRRRPGLLGRRRPHPFHCQLGSSMTPMFTHVFPSSFRRLLCSGFVLLLLSLLVLLSQSDQHTTDTYILTPLVVRLETVLVGAAVFRVVGGDLVGRAERQKQLGRLALLWSRKRRKGGEEFLVLVVVVRVRREVDGDTLLTALDGQLGSHVSLTLDVCGVGRV